MSDTYYENKKSRFQSLFKKDANENVSDFLNYIAIEINREMLDKLDDLRSSINELTKSNQRG